MKTSRMFIGMAMAAILVVAACTQDSSPEEPTRRRLPDADRPAPGVLASSALVPFDACEGFLDYVTGYGVDLVGPYGFDGGGFYPFSPVTTMAADGAAEEGGFAAEDFSRTNVQVEGVDEPDMVKSDGRRIVLLSEGTLIVADVTGPEPRVTGRLRLDELPVEAIFLSGDTVLIFGSVWGPGPLFDVASELAPVPGTPKLQLVAVDVSAAPEIVRTMTVDGRYLSARMTGDTVRLVIASGPVGFEWSYPSGSGLRAEREAIEANREIVANSTEENWIPYYLVSDGEGRVVDEGLLFGCDRASRPEEFSGLDMLSVLTIDLSQGLDPVDATGVLATGETVYASTESLYVATQSWQVWTWGRGGGSVPEQPDEIATEIHQFDISDEDLTTYLASGRVSGFLLNQFAMDEYQGRLRVASTTAPAWWGGGSDSESRVTVLERQGSELVEVGAVGGLGETEQIYSVRFLGDLAYVVTFRQTDPLYTIDLADPTRPAVAGELKIPGYSAYLQPLGDGLLLGVGQDATETGQARGSQVSLFDVADPGNPVRLDQVTLSRGSSSQVEYDHRAFLYWEATGLAVVPIQQWSWEEESGKESAFFGAVALRVDPSGDLVEVARLAHPGAGVEEGWDWRAQILRSLVIGESLYTVSAKGIMRSDLATLEEEAWLEF